MSSLCCVAVFVNVLYVTFSELLSPVGVVDLTLYHQVSSTVKNLTLVENIELIILKYVGCKPIIMK